MTFARLQKADNNFTEGEKRLLAQLETLTQSENTVHDFQLADFDPTSSQLKFGDFNLEISGNMGPNLSSLFGYYSDCN